MSGNANEIIYRVREEEKYCREHGRYLSRSYGLLRVWSPCPGCEATRNEKERAENESRESDRHEFEKAIRLQKSGIPERYVSATLDTYDCEFDGQIEVRVWARRYLQEFNDIRRNGRCFILLGNKGTGKTHIACSIASEVIKTLGRCALYTSMYDMLLSIKETWQKNHVGASERHVLARYIAPDLLIVDEVGIQFCSETERTIIFSVINSRYDALKPTLFVSNLSLPALTKMLGARVVDRIRDRGGAVVWFNWQSYRIKPTTSDC